LVTKEVIGNNPKSELLKKSEGKYYTSNGASIQVKTAEQIAIDGATKKANSKATGSQAGNNQYVDAYNALTKLSKGEISAEEAKSIFEKAGLKAPKAVESLLSKEQAPKPYTIENPNVETSAKLPIPDSNQPQSPSATVGEEPQNTEPNGKVNQGGKEGQQENVLTPDPTVPKEGAVGSSKTNQENKNKKPKKRIYAILNRILGGNSNEAIKQGIREQGYSYIPKSLDITLNEAKELIDLYYKAGTAESILRDLSNGITQDTRVALSAKLYQKYIENGENDKAIDIAIWQAKQSTEAGRAGNAAKIWKAVVQSGEDNIVLTIEKENQNRIDDATIPIADQIAKAKEQFDAELKKAFEDKVSKEVEARLARVKLITKEKKKQISDFFDSLLIDTKNITTNATIIPGITLLPHVYNGAIKIIKGAVLNGVDVANAIQQAIDYINSNQGQKIDGEVFKDYMKPKVEAMLEANGISENATLKSIDKIKNEIAELDRKINENDLSIEEKKQKEDKPQTAKTIELEKLREQKAEKQKELNKLRSVEAKGISENAIDTPKIEGKRKKEFIHEVVEAYNNGTLTDKKFKELYAKKLGIRVFSEQEKTKIRELAKIISESEKYIIDLKKDFTKENIKKHKELLRLGQKANEAMHSFSQTPNTWDDTFISIMQANVMSTISLVNNVFYNVEFQPIRFLSMGLASMLDYTISRSAKIGLLPKALEHRSIDFLAIQKGWFKGGWNGLIEGMKQVVTGVRSDDLKEIHSNFSPSRAVERWADKDRLLGQKINDYLEGTIGWEAEAMFRLLNLGDKPFRRAAELGRAFELGELKGLKGKELQQFILLPDEESANEIRKSGEQATFQQSEGLGKEIQQGITKFLVYTSKIPIVGKPAKVLLKSQIIYIKTPWNVMAETMIYSAPLISFSVGTYQISKGNKRDGTILVAKSFVGAMVMAAVYQLFIKGLITGDDDKDKNDKKKRDFQKNNTPPTNSINTSAISRGIITGKWDIMPHDTWVSYTKMGPVGILMDAHANTFKDRVSEGLPILNSDLLIKDVFTSAPKIGSSSLDQTFLQGTSTFLNAIRGGGNGETDRWLIKTTETLTSVLYPNTIANISKAFDEYSRDVKDEKFFTELKNTFKNKMFMGDELPPRVSIWGDKIKGQPDGRDKAVYYLFDPFKFRSVDTEDFRYKLYKKYIERYDGDWLPSAPDRKMTYKKKEVVLSPFEYEALSLYVGKERRKYTQAFINSDQFANNNDDVNKKLLKSFYEDGKKMGMIRFKTDMGYFVVDITKIDPEEKRQRLAALIEKIKDE
jgi:hypothetical protein